MLVWQDMPSPPALTCRSLADGDPRWARDKQREKEKEANRTHRDEVSRRPDHGPQLSNTRSGKSDAQPLAAPTCS